MCLRCFSGSEIHEASLSIVLLNLSNHLWLFIFWFDLKTAATAPGITFRHDSIRIGREMKEDVLRRCSSLIKRGHLFQKPVANFLTGFSRSQVRKGTGRICGKRGWGRRSSLRRSRLISYV